MRYPIFLSIVIMLLFFGGTDAVAQVKKKAVKTLLPRIEVRVEPLAVEKYYGEYLPGPKGEDEQVEKKEVTLLEVHKGCAGFPPVREIGCGGSTKLVSARPVRPAGYWEEQIAMQLGNRGGARPENVVYYVDDMMIMNREQQRRSLDEVWRK